VEDKYVYVWSSYKAVYHHINMFLNFHMRTRLWYPETDIATLVL